LKTQSPRHATNSAISRFHPLQRFAHRGERFGVDLAA